VALLSSLAANQLQSSHAHCKQATLAKLHQLPAANCISFTGLRYACLLAVSCKQLLRGHSVAATYSCAPQLRLSTQVCALPQHGSTVTVFRVI
jgi:hypothetical protein